TPRGTSSSTRRASAAGSRSSTPTAAASRSMTGSSSSSRASAPTRSTCRAATHRPTRSASRGDEKSPLPLGRQRAAGPLQAARVLLTEQHPGRTEGEGEGSLIGTSSLWPWLALALLGAYHGVNPAMGWLFAVALGLQEGRRGAVLRALVPIAVGHE